MTPGFVRPPGSFLFFVQRNDFGLRTGVGYEPVGAYEHLLGLILDHDEHSRETRVHLVVQRLLDLDSCFIGAFLIRRLQVYFKPVEDEIEGEYAVYDLYVACLEPVLLCLLNVTAGSEDRIQEQYESRYGNCKGKEHEEAVILEVSKQCVYAVDE